MADTKQIVCAFLKFLERHLSEVGEEQAEALEVGKQCIETGFNYDSQVDNTVCSVPYRLEEIFTAGLAALQVQGENATSSTKRPIIKPATPEEKEEAEKLKSEGNELMRSSQYKEAVAKYGEAISKDPSNAVYYCNRAAARSKINEIQESLKDCEQALSIDPNYSKAYGRKGLAHSALNQHAAARDSFKKALQMDPENASYQQNLEIAETKLRESSNSVGGAAGGMTGAPNFDLGAMFTNPALMNMATSMMQNPQMQNFISSMIQSASTQGGEGGDAQGISSILEVGQQFAQQMHTQNPELVERLRTQMQQPTGDNPPESNSKSDNPEEQPPQQ